MNIEQLKERVAYDGKPQQWKYGFDLALRETQKQIDALQAELANTHRAFESYRGETERKHGCYKPSCFAHDGCTCASGHMQKEQCPYFVIGQIKAELAALKATNAFLPIDENTPKDGTRYLAAIEVVNNQDGSSYWQVDIVGMDDVTGEIWGDDYRGWNLEDYDLWMPLPTPQEQPK